MKFLVRWIFLPAINATVFNQQLQDKVGDFCPSHNMYLTFKDNLKSCSCNLIIVNDAEFNLAFLRNSRNSEEFWCHLQKSDRKSKKTTIRALCFIFFNFSNQNFAGGIRILLAFNQNSGRKISWHHLKTCVAFKNIMQKNIV